MTKKIAPGTSNSIEARSLATLKEKTGNIYEAVAVLAKRSNQISSSLKEELHNKLSEFASSTDNLEEIHENREQIEISRYYEKMPSPTLIATQEYLDGKVYSRNPSREQ